MPSKSSTAVVHTNFDEAFRNGRVFNRLGEELTVSVKKIGDLVTTSGRLMAHDPGFLGHIEEGQAFIREVKPGSYPVFASVLQNRSQPDNDGLICAVAVRLSEEPIARWELALRPGETHPKTEDESVPAHSVDTSWSCFVDFKEIAKLSHEDRAAIFEDRIVPTMAGNRTDFAAIEINSRTGATLVACNSGFGDGGYSDFWGLSPTGNLAALATDFFILIEDGFSDVILNIGKNDAGRELKHEQLNQCHLKCTVAAMTKSTFNAKSKLTLELKGPYDKHEGHVEIFDRHGNKIGDKIETSSHGEVCKITYELSMPLTEYATVRIRLRTGIRPL